MRFVASLAARFPRRARHTFLAPALFGLAALLATPTPVAMQDMASLVAGLDGRTPNWASTLRTAVAGSVHRVELPFDNQAVTGSISGGGITAPGVGDVALVARKGARAETPDEARVNRATKQGRVTRVVPVAPPRAFNAGTIFRRTSSLLRPGFDADKAMAFSRPAIAGKEVEIAQAFHVRRTTIVPDTREMLLASLASDDMPVTLAAYGDTGNDWSADSPFEALLGGTDARAKAPVVNIAPGDHAWMSNPLPASASSEREQRCLAAGIYFESRGEPVLGQAAVAQVILNRVKNPTYPNTICGVVYQNENWRNACQFSFACDGIKDRIESPSHWRTAERVAAAVTEGRIFVPEVGSSTHYHATYVRPRWARTMERMKKIGQHIFYRTYGGGWS